MNAWTRLLLVLLRLAIGWHLLVEGYVKLHSLWTGPTDAQQPFTSRYYLQQSVGPLRGVFRWMAGGDPDEVLLSRLSLESDGENLQISRALRQYWERYLDNFAKTFQVDGQSFLQMQAKLNEHANLMANHLAKGEAEWQKFTDWGPVKKKQKLSVWLAEYRQRWNELNELENRERQYFERPVGQQRSELLRRELGWYRSQFTSELQNRTDGLLRAWHGLLPPEKKSTSYNVVPEPNVEPAMLGRSLVWWADRTTAWGLTIAGGLLLFGLLSRLGAWLGCALVLLFYLDQPPLPWVPVPQRAEGYYLFVNKNLIEVLALALLGLVPTGRWFGVDGLIHAIAGLRSKQPATAPNPQAPARPSS